MARVKLSSVVKYILFFGIGILIFYFVYRGQDPAKIWSGIKEFDIWWILLSLFFSIISHIIRALRWRMMIQPLGYYPSRINTFLAVLVMYLANFVFPRLGEVSRCGVLTKYEKVPFTEQIGTVVTERIFDFILLLLILVGVVVLQAEVLIDFVANNRERIGFDSPLITSWIFWLSIIVIGISFFILIYIYRGIIKEKKWYNKLVLLLKKFRDGLLSVRKLKKPGLFIFYSVLIYFCYFMMTYSILLGFGPSSQMGAIAAFSALAMGSVGMVIPVQGGIGTYHFFVIETLFILGLAKTDGQLVALVMHGSTTIFTIFIGLFALLALPIVNRIKSV